MWIFDVASGRSEQWLRADFLGEVEALKGGKRDGKRIDGTGTIRSG